MTSVFACDAPLTPDDDEARQWLAEELSRARYADVTSPLTRFLSSIIESFRDALSWDGRGAPPINLVLLILAIIAIAAVAIALILNPIRLSHKHSRRVFEEESNEPEARTFFDEAVAAKDWDLAYVWAYRLLVLGLDEQGVLTSSPGLTAREAASAATRVAPDLAPQLGHFAQVFDRVRYGHSRTGADQVEALRDFTPVLLAACRDSEMRS